jgi:hypothetical protein
MAFFKNFPLTIYNFNSSSSSTNEAVNVLVSAKIIDIMPERSNKCYLDYIVRDGEKPEHIANRIYKRSDYHWIVIMSNRIYNPYFDWPLSVSELDDYVAKKYPGTAIFFDCIGTDSTEFKIVNSDRYLTEDKSYFVVGNTLTQTRGNSTVTGTIKSWDPTFRRVIVDDIQGGIFTDDGDFKCTSTNIDGVEFELDPKKVILYNSDSVHHFVDDFNNNLDPYGKINYYEYNDNKIYVKKNIFYDNSSLPKRNSTDVGQQGTNDFMLNKYINGTQNNTITNRMYENMQNDIKRKIKILKPEFIDPIIKKIETIFA